MFLDIKATVVDRLKLLDVAKLNLESSADLPVAAVDVGVFFSQFLELDQFPGTVKTFNILNKLLDVSLRQNVTRIAVVVGHDDRIGQQS